MSNDKAIAEYIGRLADGIDEIAEGLDSSVIELIDFNCGEFSGGVSKTSKNIFGSIGFMRYMSNYMRTHAEEIKSGEFFNK